MSNIWTGVSRELYDDRLSAIGFVGENGERIRISTDVMESFFDTHLVSNMVFDKQKQEVRMLDMDIAYLDTYKCTSNGNCLFVPGIGETQLLNLSVPYINKCRQNYNKQKSLEDKQKKRESTAKKLAVAATVVGITATSVKGLRQNIENSSSKVLKQDVYKRLKRYYRLLGQLIDSKYKTNRLIKLDKSIIKYTRTLDGNSIPNKELRQDILKYGVLQYIKNIETLINLSVEPIIKYGLMDESLRDIGAETSIRMYISSLNSQISKIKELHKETKRLIDDNIDSHREYLANKMRLVNNTEQVKLLEQIESYIDYIENILSKEIHDSTEQEVRLSLDKINNIDTDSLRLKINDILDTDTQDEYLDYIYSLKSTITSHRYKLGNKLKIYLDEHKKSIEFRVEELRKLMISIQIGEYDTKEAQSIHKHIIEELKSLKQTIHSLPIEIRSELKDKLSNLQTIYKEIISNNKEATNEQQ